MQSVCTCGKPADSWCAQCREKAYCSRDCLRSDWPNHKPTCTETVRRRKFLEFINQRIAGNIYVAVAHCDNVSDTTLVMVEIGETIAEFLGEKSIHFVYITACKRKDKVDQLMVVYKFTDAKVATILTPKAQLDLPGLAARHPNPGTNWCVSFDL